MHQSFQNLNTTLNKFSLANNFRKQLNEENDKSLYKNLKSKQSDLNISIKRSKRKNMKGDVDYLEVEINNQSNDSIASISMNNNKTKVKMKRSVVKAHSSESSKPVSRRELDNIDDHNLSTEAYKNNEMNINGNFRSKFIAWF